MAPIEIKRIAESTDKVAEGINRLLPMLTTRNKTIDVPTLAQLVANPELFLVVAYDAEKIVGMAQLSGYSRVYGHMAWIDGMVVDAEYRGRGIATSILEELLAIAQENNWPEVNMTSKPSRIAANRVYEKAGFTKYEKNYWRIKFDESVN